MSDTRRRPRQFPTTLSDETAYLALGERLNLHAVVSLTGRLDFDRLHHAVRLSLDAEPYFNCRFVERFFRPHWQCRETSDHPMLCTLCEVPSTESLGEAVTGFMAASMDLANGPLLQVRVFRSQTDTVCVKMTHVLGDAASLPAYTQWLASLYQKLSDDPLHVPSRGPEATRDTTQYVRRLNFATKWRVASLSMRGLLQILLLMVNRRRREEVLWRFPPPGQVESRPHFARVRIPQQRASAISAYARTRKVSRNDVLLAAIYIALRRLSPGRASAKGTIGMTCDLRRELGCTTCLPPTNLFSVVPVPIEVSKSAGLDEVVEIVQRVTNERVRAKGARLANLLVLAELPMLRFIRLTLPFGLMNALVRRGRARSRARRSDAGGVLFSNMGEIDPESVRFGDLEAEGVFLNGGLLPPSRITIGVTEFRGAYSMSLLFDQAGLSVSFMDALFDELLQVLPAADFE